MDMDYYKIINGILPSINDLLRKGGYPEISEGNYKLVKVEDPTLMDGLSSIKKFSLLNNTIEVSVFYTTELYLRITLPIGSKILLKAVQLQEEVSNRDSVSSEVGDLVVTSTKEESAMSGKDDSESRIDFNEIKIMESETEGFIDQKGKSDKESYSSSIPCSDVSSGVFSFSQDGKKDVVTISKLDDIGLGSIIVNKKPSSNIEGDTVMIE